MSAPHIILDN